MEVIVLKGDSKKGKTETLTIVYQAMLLFGYTQVHGHYKKLGNPANKDFLDILEKHGTKIGIATLGDFDDYASSGAAPGEIVQDLIFYLQNNWCSKVICVCNNDLQNAFSFIQNFPQVHVITKTLASSPSSQKMKNGEDAEMIYRLI